MSEIKIPKGQILWEERYDKEHRLKAFITSDETQTKWYYYIIENGKVKKEACGKSPMDFPR